MQSPDGCHPAMRSGKLSGMCPHCKAPVSLVSIKDIQAQALLGATWKAVAYCCQACQAIISIQIDPIAIRTEIIESLGGRVPD